MTIQTVADSLPTESEERITELTLEDLERIAGGISAPVFYLR